MSIKAINSLTHYTDYTVAHVHGGALGWVGFMIFGMFYYLVPKLWKTELYSKGMATTHFWVATIGILLYIVPIWTAGIMQGLMWRAFDADGLLQYPNFVETSQRILPFYHTRVLGGLLYLAGIILMCYNVWKTVRKAEVVEDEEVTAPSLASLKPANYGGKTYWHHVLEGQPFAFAILTTVLITIGGIVEIGPLLMPKSYVPIHASAAVPYSPLELEGRDIYIREGCYNCHSQMIRPLRDEVLRYGEYSKPGEFEYDHPFQWGSKRTGPDLARVGGKYPDHWHYLHFMDPRSTSPGSIMPRYPWLAENELNIEDIQAKLRAQVILNVPYSESDIENAPAAMRSQAAQVGERLAAEGITGMENKEMVAVIAYLQRLGKQPVQLLAGQ